jgi:hypothetical protein
MGNYETTRRVIDLRLGGRRIMRRPKYRWMERVVKNVKELGISKWWVVATATKL